MNHLIRLTATDAVAGLKSGEISPDDLLDAAEERVAAVDGAVNALPTLCFERARAQARRLQHPAEPEPGYLYGLPVAIKDLMEVAGVRTTFGSPIFTDHAPEQSDLLVRQIESRGGLVIAKSNTPEFGAGAQTFNEVFGVTRNPWNPDKTPGGSSGGAAVALVTGQTWLAHGSDMGGSLRIPAAFTGCVGLRPSPGRVAHGPSEQPFSVLAVEGPMARTAADAALFLDTMTGRARMDPLSLPAPTQCFQEAVRQARPPKKVAFSMDMGISPIDAEMRRVCEEALRHFRDMGAEIVENRVDFSDAESIFQVLRAASFATSHQDKLKRHRDKLKPEMIWNIEKGMALTAGEIGEAEIARARLIHAFERQFDEVDLVVTPTVNTPPFDAGIRYLEELDGQKFQSYVSWLIMTFAITLTTCPAISTPAGFTRDGLPVGIQIIGPQRRDDLVLAAAHLFEQAAGLTTRLPIDPQDMT